MRSKAHLVPQGLRGMPDKWKEKQKQTCVAKDLFAFALFFPMQTCTHKKEKESTSLGHISFVHVAA